MNKIAKGGLIGCGGLLVLIGIAIVALIAFSGAGNAPAHRFDSFSRNPDACIGAFDGRNASTFTHIWVLHSPDLKAWWGPNGMRADADLILDSDDSEIIKAVIDHAGSTSRSPNHVRTLSTGRIYHVLLFDEPRRIYAHLRFAYRSEQANGSTVFSLVTDHDGATPVKDCPQFLDFETRYLGKPANN